MSADFVVPRNSEGGVTAVPAYFPMETKNTTALAYTMLGTTVAKTFTAYVTSFMDLYYMWVPISADGLTFTNTGDALTATTNDWDAVKFANAAGPEMNAAFMDLLEGEIGYVQVYDSATGLLAFYPEMVSLYSLWEPNVEHAFTDFMIQWKKNA